jgi:hypothetical protein
MWIEVVLAAVVAQSGDESPNQITILARSSTPYGRLFRSSVPLPEKIEWRDVYPVGFGGGLEYRGMFPYYQGRAGFYASLMLDVTASDSDFSSLGSDVELDPMMTMILSVGPTYELNLGKGFFWSGRAGVGLAAYAPVDLRSPGGSTEFFDASVAVALEVGTRLGWGNRSVTLEAGIAWRYQGGPSLEDHRYHSLSSLTIDVGVGLRF